MTVVYRLLTMADVNLFNNNQLSMSLKKPNRVQLIQLLGKPMRISNFQKINIQL